MQASWCWLDTIQVHVQGALQYCLDFAQGVLDNIRTTERGTSVSGPVRSVSEYFAYDTSDQPLGLQVLREQPGLDAVTMVVGVLAIGASSGRSWTRYAELTMTVERHTSADALPRSRST